MIVRYTRRLRTIAGFHRYAVEVVSDCSSQVRSAVAGAAPIWWATTRPRRRTISVGMDCTANRCWSLGDSSTLIFTSLIWPGFSV